MKLTRSPDGTVYVEGTPEEVRALLGTPKDAIGKMLVQYPPFAPGAAVPFGGTFTVKPQPECYWPTNAAAAAPQFSSFIWTSNAGA